MMQTYLEIFKEHYPNVVLKGFYGNYCPAGFFKYGMDMHHPDCSAECDKCWSSTADSEWCESGDYEIPEEWKGISAPAQTEAAVPTDKYAEAVQLNAQIMTSARAAQQNLYDMAMGFKKMRDDKLYKELGYDNFGDYCEGETGMHRKNVYNYISIVEHLPADFVTSTLQIGKEKLYLLSTIDEEHRTEIIENTDLESTTVKELREQIEQLKQSEAKTKLQLEEAEEHNAALSAEKEQFHRASKANLEKLNEERERNTELEKQLEDAKFHSQRQSESFDRVAKQSDVNYKKYLDEMHKNQDLTKQIRELESRPVEVAVQSDSDAERKFNETIRKINLDFELFRDEADKELADMRNQRNAALDRAEAAEAQLNAPKEEGDIKPFLIKMTMDDFTALHEAVRNDPRLKNILTKAQVIRI